MTLAEATELIKGCGDKMSALYNKPVFDEWAVISLIKRKERILTYLGPRKEDFQKNFAHDVEALRADLMSEKHGLGDFEFARHAGGTHFDAFVVLGEGLYLICNNTNQSMHGITKDPLWLNAQVPFAGLADRFRSNPLNHPL